MLVDVWSKNGGNEKLYLWIKLESSGEWGYKKKVKIDLHTGNKTSDIQ
jgi:hypothetical protein